jgi:hypothetical protein
MIVRSSKKIYNFIVISIFSFTSATVRGIVIIDFVIFSKYY